MNLMVEKKHEVLNPRERFGLLVIDEKPDRCNIIPLITSHAATVARISLKEYHTDGIAMAKAQIAAIEEYGHDAISIFSEVGIIAEAMGSEFTYPANDLPILKNPALTKVGVEDLKIPDPKKDGRLSVYLEAIDYAYSAVGDRIPILAYIPAPFTTGMMLSDPNQFLLDTIKNPVRIKKLIEIGLKAAIDFSYEVINVGGLPILVDPLASGSVISPKAFQDFALPGEQGLINFLHRYDFDVILHICGDTTPLLDSLLLTGADLISLDRVDLNLALQKLAKKIRIIGNFDTSKIGFGSTDEIAKEVKEMVRIGIKAEKGYIASTGCEVPIRTPVENVKTFISAAKEVGWYWD